MNFHAHEKCPVIIPAQANGCLFRFSGFPRGFFHVFRQLPAELFNCKAIQRQGTTFHYQYSKSVIRIKRKEPWKSANFLYLLSKRGDILYLLMFFGACMVSLPNDRYI